MKYKYMIKRLKGRKYFRKVVKCIISNGIMKITGHVAWKSALNWPTSKKEKNCDFPTIRCKINI